MSAVLEAAWRERLGAATRLQVSGAAAFGALKGELRRNAVYVVRLGEQALTRDNPSTRPRQVVEVRMGVLYGFADYSDSRGQGAAGKVEQARAQVREALLGWEPPGGFGMARFAQGRMLELTGKALWWQDEWLLDELWQP